MLLTFLLVVHAIIAAMLVGVILVQKSEGGGLTSGGSNSSLMTARGTADFLTRATSILGTLFIVMAIGLAMYAATQGSNRIDASQARTPQAPASAPAAPQSTGDDALADAAARMAAAQNAANAANAAAAANSQVPLQQ